MFWILLTAVVIFTVLCIWLTAYCSSDWNKEGWMILAAMGVVVGAIFFLGLGIWKWSLHYDRVNCNNYEQKTGRDTTFIKTNWGSWDCYTPASDGKLVPTDQIGDYNK